MGARSCRYQQSCSSRKASSASTSRSWLLRRFRTPKIFRRSYRAGSRRTVTAIVPVVPVGRSALEDGAGLPACTAKGRAICGREGDDSAVLTAGTASPLRVIRPLARRGCSLVLLMQPQRSDVIGRLRNSTTAAPLVRSLSFHRFPEPYDHQSCWMQSRPAGGE
jgi:hypothetical protein